MKDDDIIIKIKKAYEVKTPNIYDKLHFQEDEAIPTFFKEHPIVNPKIFVRYAGFILIIAFIGITVICFRINSDFIMKQLTNTHSSTTTPSVNNPTVDESDIPKLSYEISYNMDYATATDPESLFEAADVVIEGIFGNVISTYATEDGRIISVGRIHDINIMKGEKYITGEDLKISYYGGIMSISEYKEQIYSTISLKRGYDKLTKEEADKQYIGYSKDKCYVNPKQGSKYLIFLSYNKEDGEYFVLCDGYGMREINNEGKVWNIDSSEYEEFYKKKGNEE